MKWLLFVGFKKQVFSSSVYMLCEQFVYGKIFGILLSLVLVRFISAKVRKFAENDIFVTS